MTQRRWTIPRLTPIIEVNPKPDPNDPFTSPDPKWKPIEVYNADQLKLWLQRNGVGFPPNSKVTHQNGHQGASILIIKNTPSNLDLVDWILSSHYPAHTSLQLMKRFLLETKEAPLEKLIPKIRKYPGQTIGPLRNLIEELKKLDDQLAAKPEPNLKKIVSRRRDRILKQLPTALQATRDYFTTLVKAMESPE